MREAVINSYEVTFILGEAATATEATAKTKEITALIKKFGGDVSKDEQWGKRDLAYPINRNRTGFYVTLWFTLPSDQVAPLERALRFDESVIRSLVTKAYTTAQPGSLYPVPEEEKPARGSRRGAAPASEAVSAEEELRLHTGDKKSKAAPKEEAPEDELSEEDRLKQLDQAMDELLKDPTEDESDS
jgi:small subunit ribosomal protein S6